MNIKKVKLVDLKRPEKNSRMHPDKQIQEMVRSLEQYGQTRAIVIDEDNVIWIGNGLYEAMIRLGWTEAYAERKTGLTRKEKIKMMMADNRIYELGVDDLDVFDAFVKELQDDFDVPGFDEDLLKSLVMDEKQIADALGEYGTIDDAHVENIKEMHTRYEAQDNTAAQSAEEYIPPAQSPQREQDSAPSKYILCPKCGERIWL